MPNGSILNLSSKPLWVVETDTDRTVAHRLEPGHRSPRAVDADGVRAVDGTPISDHDSWWKFRLIEVEVVDDPPALRIRRCVAPACLTVGDDEFGPMTFDPAPGWGQPIDESGHDKGRSAAEGENRCEPEGGARRDAAENARVTKAKQLYEAQANYARGCSGYVSEVLGISWEDANALMGSNPTSVGDNNNYSGLSPGDIVGWNTSGGSGHVAVYVGDPGMKFLDVRDEGGKPRKVVNGYGLNRELFKSSRF